MKKTNITLAQVGNVIYNLPANSLQGYSPDNDTALIVHKDPQKVGWNVSHESGWALVKHIRTRKNAMQCAEELGWLANWHNITTENASEWYTTNKAAFLEIKGRYS